MATKFNISGELAPHIGKLLDDNREHLITSAVPDDKTREKLLAINKAIVDLKRHDPKIVAAWGLGCGGSCLTEIEDRFIDRQ